MAILRWGGPVLLLLALLVLWGLGDRWWGALPLLYGPRWVLMALVPVPLLTVRWGRRAAILATGTGCLLALLLLDARLPWRAVFDGIQPEDRTSYSVVSWNAGGGGAHPEPSARTLSAGQPAVIVVAECGASLAAALAALPGYSVRETARVCLATTLPIREWSPRDPSDFWQEGGGGSIGRLVVEANGRELVVGGVHLETPREALEDFQNLALRSFIETDAKKRSIRDRESRAAREWIAGPSEARPVIIAGDFNLPVESAIYRRWWGDLTNAFNVRGLGTGWTKMTSRFGVRIDHIVLGNGVRVTAARTGPAMGSDHRPVLATVVLPNQ